MNGDSQANIHDGVNQLFDNRFDHGLPLTTFYKSIALPVIALLLTATLSCGPQPLSNLPPEPVHQPRILDRAPHDTNAFTQGLLIDGDRWLESTGLYGQSELREVDRATGDVLRRVRLDARYFGEGLALHDGRLYQLTWKEQVCFVYDRETFEQIDLLSYSGEGWGLAGDGTHLYMSDGSDTIRVMNPKDFTEIRRFQVRSSAGPVEGLNEMAWIEGELWANIFPTRWIVRFAPDNGRVTGFLDLRHLPPTDDTHPDQDVLNGIAYDPSENAVWVTGKKWKQLYRLEWP